MEQLVPDMISKEVEEKKVIRSNQGEIMLDQSDNFICCHEQLHR